MSDTKSVQSVCGQSSFKDAVKKGIFMGLIEKHILNKEASVSETLLTIRNVKRRVRRAPNLCSIMPVTLNRTVEGE